VLRSCVTMACRMHSVSQRWLMRVLMLAFWTVGVPVESFAQAPPAAPAAARDMDYLKAEGGLASLPSPVWVQKRPVPLAVHFAVTKDLREPIRLTTRGAFARGRRPPAIRRWPSRLVMRS
jgi:hypothetical protein